MKLSIALTALALTACSSAGLQFHDPAYQKRPTLTGSLIRDAQGGLTEEMIQKLLASRVVFPERAKLAVVPIAHIGIELRESWGVGRGTPVEFLQARRAFLDAVEEPLFKTGRFTEITHIPDLLLPPDVTITRIRDAAALMQADLLMIYATKAQLLTYEGGLFTKDTVRAFVSVELVVMDVRTGVVPFAEVFEDVYEIKKDGAIDWNLPDLQRRAEQEGLLKVFKVVGTRLVRFVTPK